MIRTLALAACLLLSALVDDTCSGALLAGSKIKPQCVIQFNESTHGNSEQLLPTSGSSLFKHSNQRSDGDRCETLETRQCLDVTLPYSRAAPKFDTEKGLTSQAAIHAYLSQWSGLRRVPQCWRALQSILCPIFFPRCELNIHSGSNLLVPLPTYEMCRTIRRGPCKLIERHFQWPKFLDCDNATVFPKGCPNEYRDLKFNTSAAKCGPPLVQTDDQRIWYPGIEGCALQCRDPVYSEKDHLKIKNLIYYGALISFLVCLFASLTFVIDWKSNRKYPPVIIFYLNLCHCLASVGWLAQFYLEKNESAIVCRSIDQTLRFAEPSTPESSYCLIVFILIYYFTMAASIWFVALAFSWSLSFKSPTQLREFMDTRKTYIHFTAWSVPVILIVLLIALNEIDGDSIRGICFVAGLRQPLVRFIFVFIPHGLFLVVGNFFFVRAIIVLIGVRRTSAKMTVKSNPTSTVGGGVNTASSMTATQEHQGRSSNDKSKSEKSPKTSHKQKPHFNHQSKKVDHRQKKINLMILRLIIFDILAIGSFIANLTSFTYENVNRPSWMTSLDDQIVCSLEIDPALNFEQRSWGEFESGISYDNEENEEIAHISKRMCTMMNKPNLFFIYAELVLLFAYSIVTGSWVWTRSSLLSWRRFIVKKVRPPNYGGRDPIRAKRHALISEAYSKRHKTGRAGNNDPPVIHSLHEDPVAMNLTSAESQNLSTTWIAAFSTMLLRRGAVADANQIRSGLGHHYLAPYYPSTRHSSISDVSQGHQRFSTDTRVSRRRSIESAQSLEQELAAIARHQRRKSRKEREKLKALYSTRSGRLSLRRGSDSSTQSILAAAARAVSRLSNNPGFPGGEQVETKATSTGDLMSLVTPLLAGHLPHPNGIPHQAVPNQHGMFPPQMPFGPAMPFSVGHQMPTPLHHHITPQPGVAQNGPAFRPRLPKPPITAHPFTHGMSDQTKGLTNPLLEQRRPDSTQPTPHSTPRSISALQSAMSNLTTGYRSDTLNPAQLGPGQGTAFGHAPQHLTALLQNQYYASNLMMAANFYHAAAVQALTPNGTHPYMGSANSMGPSPGIQPSYDGPLPPHGTQEDLLQLLRERIEYEDLIRPTESASEFGGDIKSIQLSDNDDSCFSRQSTASSYDPSFGGGHGRCPSVDVQKMVDERIQKVEAELEVNDLKDEEDNNNKEARLGK